ASGRRLVRTAAAVSRRLGWRDVDGLRMEGLRARGKWSPHDRGRIQGSGAYRARRLGCAPTVSVGERLVRSARAHVRSLQFVVRRAGDRTGDAVRECGV